MADSIRALVASPGQRREFNAPAAVDWASGRMGVELTEEQRQAVHEAVSQKVFVLTGGPGTGKTTILRAVILVLEALGQRVALAAPTGRAAKRLGEAAGREAQTLHRLNQYQSGMCILGVLKTTEMTTRLLASPLDPKRGATDSPV